MQKRIQIKNHQEEVQLTFHRSMIGLIVICLLILLLIIRLSYLQIHKHDIYTTLATKNALDLVPVEPTRGLIYDRNGVLLAENIPVFSLDIIPVKVPNLDKTLAEVSKIVDISENDLAQFRRQQKQHRRFDEIPLKLRLSDEEVARFAENQHRFPGVFIKARLIRHYPYGESFSHVIGNVGRINSKELSEIDPANYSASHYIGKLGIEKYYEDDLHGKVGYEEVENDASGKPLRVISAIKGNPGKNLYLTIDSGLQFIAEKALGDHSGAVVAIQPATGQVLAFVSKPGYDPNIFVLGISQADYQTLQNSPERPLFNRALRGLYPLASTIKPYLALKALDSEVTTPTETIFDPGYFEIKNVDRRYRCWQHRGHGTVNISKAVTSSCDTYFYNLSLKMGIQKIDEILIQFGYGTLTGIDLDNELAGIIATPEWKKRERNAKWFDGDTLNSSIGQGFMQATPLQLAVAISTLGNRGQHYMPYLLFGVQTPGQPYASQKTSLLEPVVLKNEKNWDLVIDAMQNVIDSPEGTAYRPYGSHQGYSIAGKTGTAQVISKRGTNPDEMDNQLDLPEKLRDHALFVAFAPVEQPLIAVAVITEHSHEAVPVAKAVIDYYLEAEKHADKKPEGENNSEAEKNIHTENTAEIEKKPDTEKNLETEKISKKKKLSEEDSDNIKKISNRKKHLIREENAEGERIPRKKRHFRDEENEATTHLSRKRKHLSFDENAGE